MLLQGGKLIKHYEPPIHPILNNFWVDAPVNTNVFLGDMWLFSRSSINKKRHRLLFLNTQVSNLVSIKSSPIKLEHSRHVFRNNS